MAGCIMAGWNRAAAGGRGGLQGLHTLHRTASRAPGRLAETVRASRRALHKPRSAGQPPAYPAALQELVTNQCVLTIHLSKAAGNTGRPGRREAILERKRCRLGGDPVLPTSRQHGGSDEQPVWDDPLCERHNCRCAHALAPAKETSSFAVAGLSS
eukprot:365319-Chlamydomonas_euryale.AAC.18